jgi:hypothetical protein
MARPSLHERESDDYRSGMSDAGPESSGSYFAPENRPASRAEIAIWTAVVLAATILPGVGIVIAAVLAFKRLRYNPIARWVLLGVAILATAGFVSITT